MPMAAAIAGPQKRTIGDRPTRGAGSLRSKEAPSRGANLKLARSRHITRGGRLHLAADGATATSGRWSR